MERFIADFIDFTSSFCSFKIQYGEIYSEYETLMNIVKARFKIQYGEIYRIT